MPLPTALEKVVGKPWSAWVSLAGSNSPSDPPVTKRNGEILSSGAKRNHHNINNEAVDPTNTHSRRLNRSEMAIFGGCPASEKLTLIPCSYCGDKFKCPALADHIRLRHGGAKKPLKIGSPDKKKSPSHIRTKGKHGRLSKDKEKLIEPPTVVEEAGTKSQDWPKNKPEVEGNHRNEREISVTSVVPQFMLKNSGSESVKESPKSSRDSKAKIKKPRVLEPSLPVINDVPPPLEKSPAPQKRESGDPVELSPGRSKEKTKSEVLSKKAKLDQTVKVASPEESKIQIDTTVSAEPPPPEPPKLTQEVKPSEPKKKKGQKSSTMRGGRVYDPDNHCGVISKENSRPCTRSLSCKQHSITLRKAVKGRTRSFDVLLSTLQKEKELERNKVLDVEIVNSIINHPSSIKISTDLLDVEAKPKSPKVESKLNQPSDVGKFTLPVSIKNPNLWSQLQAPAEPITPPSVVEISKSPQSSSVLLKKPVSNSLIYKVMKEDKVKDNIKEAHSVPKPVAVNGFHKEKDIPFEGFLLPGYRKSSGLFTTSYSVSRMHFKDGQKFRLNSTRDSYDKNYQRNGYFLYLNSSNSKNIPEVLKDSSVPNNAHKCYDFLKLPDKNVIASMPSIATQVNPLKGIKTSGDVNTVTKPLNLFGPINGSSVLPLSLIPQTKDRKSDGFIKLGGNTVETPSAGIMSGDQVRLDSPRTHFFTPSGPISLAVDRSASAQLSCKQLQPKLQYLPNSSLTTSGIVYLQRTLKTVY
uniref:Ataxin-7 n=1 Tax=Lygus hesperus TaxID=30085 RepID=A0A146LJY4_LYGHE